MPEGYAADMSRFDIVGLNYVSLYPADHRAAIDFYTEVFGPIDVESPDDGVWGWQMGSTWLTVFPGTEGPDPTATSVNAEFAIQVGSPTEVDRLFEALVASGAKAGSAPEDTWMYEPMRFAYVDDPYGVRIDVYCPITEASTDQ